MLFPIGQSILHSCEVHEVGKVVEAVAAVAAHHSASLGDVVHPSDFVLPLVDVAPVLPLQDPRGRHQGVEVLLAVDLKND